MKSGNFLDDFYFVNKKYIYILAGDMKLEKILAGDIFKKMDNFYTQQITFIPSSISFGFGESEHYVRNGLVQKLG